MKYIALLSVLLLAACTIQKRPEMTEEEFKAVTTRTFKGVTTAQVIEAAERVLYLADGDDFKLNHDDGELQAYRRWHVYVILGYTSGSDHWSIKPKGTDNGVQVSVKVNTTVNAQPGGFANGMYIPGTSGSTDIVKGTALYDLFFSRLEYVLGKTTHWQTCDEADQRVTSGATWGNNSALCSIHHIKDNAPDEAAKKEPKQENQ